MIPCSVVQEYGVEGQHASKQLQLTFEKHVDVVKGEFIPRADAQSAPKIAVAMSSFEAKADAKYILVSLDPDAPFFYASFLSPILHWIQPNVKVTQDGSLDYANEPTICPYAPPRPPFFAHRYIFLLYEQPADFDVESRLGKVDSLTSRVRFDWDAWAKEAKLGPVLASSYVMSK